MKATFVELPPFERYRREYLDDEAFSALQQELMTTPLAGDQSWEQEDCAKSGSPTRAETRGSELARGLFIIGGTVAHSFGYLLCTTKMKWQTYRMTSATYFRKCYVMN